MIHLLIRHEVADFTVWKAAYDAHEPVRRSAALKELKLLRGVDNPNEVVLLFAGEDLKKARAFLTAADLPEIMKKAGVVGKPEVSLLNG